MAKLGNERNKQEAMRLLNRIQTNLEIAQSKMDQIDFKLIQTQITSVQYLVKDI